MLKLAGFALFLKYFDRIIVKYLIISDRYANYFFATVPQYDFGKSHKNWAPSFHSKKYKQEISWGAMQNCIAPPRNRVKNEDFIYLTKPFNKTWYQLFKNEDITYLKMRMSPIYKWGYHFLKIRILPIEKCGYHF